jgi:hypothetical protein
MAVLRAGKKNLPRRIYLKVQLTCRAAPQERKITACFFVDARVFWKHAIPIDPSSRITRITIKKAQRTECLRLIHEIDTTSRIDRPMIRVIDFSRIKRCSKPSRTDYSYA